MIYDDNKIVVYTVVYSVPVEKHPLVHNSEQPLPSKTTGGMSFDLLLGKLI